MSDLIIKVGEDLTLSGVIMEDKSALLEHLQTKEIYDTTMNIPFPYFESDADWWLNKQVERTRRQEKETTFALRDSEKLIGVLGADSLELAISHRAEIGYWLAKPYWGRGIMTDAVRAYVRYAFAELSVARLTAHVFAFNRGSARVLEKNGFTLEGRLRKHFSKNGELIDGFLYGLLKEEVI